MKTLYIYIYIYILKFHTKPQQGLEFRVEGLGSLAPHLLLAWCEGL